MCHFWRLILTGPFWIRWSFFAVHVGQKKSLFSCFCSFKMLSYEKKLPEKLHKSCNFNAYLLHNFFLQKSISKKQLFSTEWSVAIAKITALYFEMAFTSRADENCAPRSNVPAQHVQCALACGMVALMMTNERTRLFITTSWDLRLRLPYR